MDEDQAARPNIRIEIQNNLMEEDEEEIIQDASESMLVDDVPTEEKLKENESGEIDEGEEGEITDELDQDITYLTRPTEDESERNKLKERSKRFAMIASEGRSLLTNDELQELYSSLRVDKDKMSMNTILMHGVDGLTSSKIFEFFAGLKPKEIEWMENSCHVIWDDENVAAKAMYERSEPIKGLEADKTNELMEGEGEGRSILLRNRDVEFQDETNGIDVSEIDIPIPSGRWRLGLIKCFRNGEVLRTFKMKVLLRFPLMSEMDKFVRVKTERGIFDRNHAIDDDKNPWGSLARNWHEDARFAEPEYRELEEEPKNPVLQKRLGFKRALPEEPEEIPRPEKRTKVPRMRMYADEEEEKIRRRKQLQALKPQSKPDIKSEDLRNVLRIPKKEITDEIFNVQEIIRDHRDVTDLGLKLKNRKIKEAQKILDSQIRIQVDRSHRPIRHPPRRKPSPVPSEYDEDYSEHKTGSKVAVVIKKQRTPVVASRIMSRMNSEKERLKTVSEGKLRVRDSSSSVSTSSDSSDSDSELKSNIERPGFKGEATAGLLSKIGDHRSPLRIEINNDHFRKE